MKSKFEDTKKVTEASDQKRLVGRLSARVLTEEDIQAIAGGAGCTRTFSNVDCRSQDDGTCPLP